MDSPQLIQGLQGPNGAQQRPSVADIPLKRSVLIPTLASLSLLDSETILQM
jgi:hypothetical protein